MNNSYVCNFFSLIQQTSALIQEGLTHFFVEVIKLKGQVGRKKF